MKNPIKKGISIVLSIILILSSQSIFINADSKTLYSLSDYNFTNLENEYDFEAPPGGVLTDIREIENIPKDIISANNTLPYFNSYAAYSNYSDAKRYGYTKLTDNQKSFYDNCLSAITTFIDTDYKTKDYTSEANNKNNYAVVQAKYSDYSLSLKDASAVFWCIRNDYPEFYWLYYGYQYTSSSIFFLIGEDYYTPAARSQADNYISSALNEYKNAVSGITDTYEIVRTIHDKIITNIEYSYDSNGDPEDALWAHSMIGVFDSHKGAVCEGYSKAFQYILNELNVENIYMTGYANGPHAWNGVKIGDSYFYVDATWDDSGSSKYDGINYNYFCIPSSLFLKRHTIDTPDSSSWMYEIPEMSNSYDFTYYSKYYSNLSNVTDSSEAESKLRYAGMNCPGNYMHILTSDASVSIVAKAIRNIENTPGASISYSITPLGNVIYVLSDIYKTTVNNPAASIVITPSAITIDTSISTDTVASCIITASNGSASDDIIRWSSSSDCISLIPDGNNVKITGKRNGTATITATALKGGISSTCTVTIIGTNNTRGIFLTSDLKTIPRENDLTIWVNGGNIKLNDTNKKYNYKTRILYTDIRPSKIVTVNKNGKTKTANGKLIVGVTLSNETPVLNKNKIVDAEAAKIASATINQKTGLIKITAKKTTGTVYLWVIDTGDAHSYAYAKINIKAAPSKIIVNDKNYSDDSRNVIKKTTLTINESTTVYLEPLANNKTKEIANESSYKIQYGKNSEKYIKVEKLADYDYSYVITATDMEPLKNGKTVNAKVSFICNENNKKTTINVVITNPVNKVNITAENAIETATGSAFVIESSNTQAVTSNFTINAVTSSNEYKTTDTVKIYNIASADAFSFNNKNKISYTKATGYAAKITAKLSKDKNTITIKLPKNLPDNTTAYFLLVYNNNYTKVFSVTGIKPADN